MDSRRLRSLKYLIFIFCAISCFDSPTSAQVGSNYGGVSFVCISDYYIMQSYFTTRSSLNDSEFRSFLLLQECPDKIQDPHTLAPSVAFLQRRGLTGEGSHRHLLTSIKLHRHSEFPLHELVVVERLPLGVFADPFELQNLHQLRAFSNVSVFGDTNLELPSFRSNRSVVEIHVDISSGEFEDGEITFKLPLHARYPPLEDSGYSRVEFGDPDLFLCSRHLPNTMRHEQRRCLVLSIARSKGDIRSVVVWKIPAGIRNHTEYVSAFTFVAAVLSAFSIIVASISISNVQSCKNSKQS